MWHWLIWLTPPWGRSARRRAVLKQVKRWQADERQRAFGRIEYYSRVQSRLTWPDNTPRRAPRSHGDES